jgi:hypothetical protein
MQGKNVNNDRDFRRPRAWAKTKEAIGPCELLALMERLETRGYPRRELAAAIRMYLKANSADKFAAMCPPTRASQAT